MSTGHSVFAPSSYSRWSQCAPSIFGNMRYEDSQPEPFNPHSALGTLAHEVGEYMLLGKDHLTIEPEDGLKALGVKVDDDMVEYVSIYTNFVHSTVKSLKGKLFVEKRVNLPHIHPDFGGTSDAIVVSSDGSHVHVIDLKYGVGVQVFADHNPQLMIYALGSIATLGIVGVETVSVSIVQPRLDHIDTFTLSMDELAEFEAEVAASVKAAEAILPLQFDQISDERFNPSPEACMWCPMKLECKALKNKSLEYIKDLLGDDDDDNDDAFSVKPDPAAVSVPISNEDLDGTLKYIWQSERLLAILRKAYEAEAFSRLTKPGAGGDELPSFKIVGSNPNRKWKESPELIQLLTKLCGKDAFEQKLISPAKAEKILKKDLIAKDALKEFIDRGTPTPSLAAIGDKRDRFKPEDRKIDASSFDDLSGEFSEFDDM
jgi:hypothetical protein